MVLNSIGGRSIQIHLINSILEVDSKSNNTTILHHKWKSYIQNVFVKVNIYYKKLCKVLKVKVLSFNVSRIWMLLQVMVKLIWTIFILCCSSVSCIMPHFMYSCRQRFKNLNLVKVSKHSCQICRDLNRQHLPLKCSGV